MPADTTEIPATAGVSSPQAGVTEAVQLWWQQAQTLVYDQLQLLTLEGERVALSMVALLVFGLLAGLLALTLWFALLAQIVLLAQYSVFTAAQALGLAMIVNLLGFWFVLRRCRYYSRFLRFPATLQSLRLAADPVHSRLT